MMSNMTYTNELKQQVISRIKHDMTTADVRCIVEEILAEKGLRPYNGEAILPGFRKGHFKIKNQFTIYKTECEHIEDNSLCIIFSKYGVGNTEMYFTVDSIETSGLTKEEELRAKMWADMNLKKFIII